MGLSQTFWEGGLGTLAAGVLGQARMTHGEWPGAQAARLHRSSTCHSPGRGSCFQKPGCWVLLGEGSLRGTGRSGSLRGPRMGSGGHRSGVWTYSFSYRGRARRLSHPENISASAALPQGRSWVGDCCGVPDSPRVRVTVYSLQSAFTHMQEPSPLPGLPGCHPPSPQDCQHQQTRTVLPPWYLGSRGVGGCSLDMEATSHLCPWSCGLTLH